MNKKLLIGSLCLLLFCLAVVGIAYAAKLSVGVPVSFPVDI
jgi:hypothetical protein